MLYHQRVWKGVCRQLPAPTGLGSTAGDAGELNLDSADLRMLTTSDSNGRRSRRN